MLKNRSLLLSGFFLIDKILFSYLMSLIQHLLKVLWIAKKLTLNKIFLRLHKIFLFTTFQISYLNNSHIIKKPHALTFLKMEFFGQCLMWFRYVSNWHFLHKSSQKGTLNYTLHMQCAIVNGLQVFSKKTPPKQGERAELDTYYPRHR